MIRFISSLVFLYVRIMNETSRKSTKNIYFLSQVEEIGHLKLTIFFKYRNLSQFTTFDIIIISEHFNPHLISKSHKNKNKNCQSTLVITKTYIPLVPSSTNNQKEIAMFPHSTRSSSSNKPCPLLPKLHPIHLPKKRKKKEKEKKKPLNKNQFLHQAQSYSCLTHFKASIIIKWNEQCQSMSTKC